MTFLSLVLAIAWLAVMSNLRETTSYKFNLFTGIVYEFTKLSASIAIAFAPYLLTVFGIL
ncbi:hypothetical protein AVV44_gp122 [Cronobacter phage S13]|jgi:hypothetical protein|uniref:Uncharacterized protein n=1 Tax=Cronobacter phage LPCS28 TaxID=2924885 RepID=A0AAE9G8V4_9CAUD|nr:hypothetical protein AVV44_gp122 [Cronobacter phage S13]YP_010665974.1 hypothetical protein PQB73_gp050 [Cronobacter phage LPCS28]AIA64921.1 hypothetical protein S13_122 [Cronobacter phage S13]UNY47163.1 hypothetical protein EHEKIMEA_00281 [Cronobacter phage LPCS28]